MKHSAGARARDDRRTRSTGPGQRDVRAGAVVAFDMRREGLGYLDVGNGNDGLGEFDRGALHRDAGEVVDDADHDADTTAIVTPGSSASAGTYVTSAPAGNEPLFCSTTVQVVPSARPVSCGSVAGAAASEVERDGDVLVRGDPVVAVHDRGVRRRER